MLLALTGAEAAYLTGIQTPAYRKPIRIQKKKKVVGEV